MSADGSRSATVDLTDDEWAWRPEPARSEPVVDGLVVGPAEEPQAVAAIADFELDIRPADPASGGRDATCRLGINVLDFD